MTTSEKNAARLTNAGQAHETLERLRHLAAEAIEQHL